MPNYKINGAKFASMDELKSSLWEIYKDKMSQEEFEMFVQENTEEV
jgi:hypothetical protein